tara:strand:+ start:23333 stop:23485 length:153 start_codon:yes stop_codon:yes gene_type:complete
MTVLVLAIIAPGSGTYRVEVREGGFEDAALETVGSNLKDRKGIGGQRMVV